MKNTYRALLVTVAAALGVACTSETSLAEATSYTNPAEEGYVLTSEDVALRAALLQECREYLKLPFGEPLPFTPPTAEEFAERNWQMPEECFPERG